MAVENHKLSFREDFGVDHPGEYFNGFKLDPSETPKTGVAGHVLKVVGLPDGGVLDEPLALKLFHLPLPETERFRRMTGSGRSHGDPPPEDQEVAPDSVQSHLIESVKRIWASAPPNGQLKVLWHRIVRWTAREIDTLIGLRHFFNSRPTAEPAKCG